MAELTRFDVIMILNSGKNFAGIDLSGLVLRGLDFSGANLRGATIAGADLRGINFAFADMTGANLAYSDLSGAKLNGTALDNAILRGANLLEADFGDLNSGSGSSFEDDYGFELDWLDLSDAEPKHGDTFHTADFLLRTSDFAAISLDVA